MLDGGGRSGGRRSGCGGAYYLYVEVFGIHGSASFGVVDMVEAQDVDTPHEMVDAIGEQSSWSSLSSKLQCCISASANERPPPPTPYDEQQSKKLPAPNCSSPKIYLDASFASLKRSISGVWHARPAASHSPRLRRGDPARYRRSICRPEGSPRRRNDRAPLTRGGRDGAHR